MTHDFWKPLRERTTLPVHQFLLDDRKMSPTPSPDIYNLDEKLTARVIGSALSELDEYLQFPKHTVCQLHGTWAGRRVVIVLSPVATS